MINFDILLNWILVYYSSTTSDSDNVEAAAAAQPRSQRRFVFAKKSSQKDFQCKEKWNDSEIDRYTIAYYGKKSIW